MQIFKLKSKGTMHFKPVKIMLIFGALFKNFIRNFERQTTTTVKIGMHIFNTIASTSL